jgi:hypothetical protein
MKGYHSVLYENIQWIESQKFYKGAAAKAFSVHMPALLHFLVYA